MTKDELIMLLLQRGEPGDTVFLWGEGPIHSVTALDGTIRIQGQLLENYCSCQDDE